jgi:hypothetical protein
MPRAQIQDEKTYQALSKKDLAARARELGIPGRSPMTRDELIKALRNR